jgi:uncharacterized protein YfaS (alpha-2-macroglobulin family)
VPVEVPVNEFKAGVAHVPLNLPRVTSAGAWRVEVRAAGENVLGAAPVQVRAFVPNRIELQIAERDLVAPNQDKNRLCLGAGLDNVVLKPGKPISVELCARYLHGAPAAGLGGVYRVLLRRSEHPFPGFEAFQFGSEGDAIREVGPIRPLQRTLNDGTTQVEVMLASARAPFPVEALLRVQVNDTDGGNVGKEFALKVRGPDQTWIGARALQPTTAFETASVEVLSVDGDGRRVATSGVRWELYAEEEAFQWERQRDAHRYAYEVSTSARLLKSGTLDIAADASTKLPVDAPLDGEYQPGDAMTVRVDAAFPGELMLLIASDSIHKVVNQSIGAEPATVRLPVEAGWGPRPYVLATIFRSGASGSSPGRSRAMGAAGFAVRPAGSSLTVTIDAASARRRAERCRSIFRSPACVRENLPILLWPPWMRGYSA